MPDPSIYAGIDLIGGGTGAIDKINGSVLIDKNMFATIKDGVFYPHWLDDDSGAGENSPLIISPDLNADTKRWLLAGGVFAGLTMYGNIVMPDFGTIGQSDGPLITFNNTDDYLHITGCLVGIGGNPVAGFIQTIHGNADTHGMLRTIATVDGKLSGVYIERSGSATYDYAWWLGLKDGQKNFVIFDNVAGASRFMIDLLGNVTIGGDTATDLLELVNSVAGPTDTTQLRLVNNGDTSGMTSIEFWGKTQSNTGPFQTGKIQSSFNGGTTFPDTVIKLQNISGTDTFIDAIVLKNGGVSMPNLKSGTDQANAGAAAGELYSDTNDDNTIKMGV